MYIETLYTDRFMRQPSSPLPPDLQAYATVENVDSYALNKNIKEIQEQAPTLATEAAVRLSNAIDQALPALWWAGVDAIEKLPGHTKDSPEQTSLSEKDSILRTREQMMDFLAEELTPIRHSSLKMLISALQETPSEKAKRVLPLLEEYLQFSEQNLSQLLDNIARIRVSGLALNAILPVAANANSAMALATSGAAIPLAEFHAHAMANAYNTMNDYLRAGIENGSIVEFKALQALGFSVDSCMERFVERSKRGELLFRTYPYIISQRAYTNSEAGLIIGSAISTALTGEINPMTYGLIGNRVKTTANAIWDKITHRKAENFSAWFNTAQSEVTALADKAIFAEDPQPIFQEIYKRSQDMLQHINKYGNLPVYKAEHRYSWIIQFISNIMSSSTAQALIAGGTIKAVGLLPFLAMEKLKADEVKARARQVDANQAFSTLNQQHAQESQLYANAIQRNKSIQASTESLSAMNDKSYAGYKMYSMVLLNGEIKPVDISLQYGLNFFVGESGSGKSTAIENLMAMCDHLNIPYGYSPVKMLQYISAGSFLSQIISSVDDIANSHFATYMRHQEKHYLAELINLNYRDVADQKFKEITSQWTQEWLSIQSRRSDTSTPVLDDTRWSKTSRELNQILCKYLREIFQIHNPEEVLLTNGSEGQRKRLEICSCIQNPQAEFIFIDESFAHLDPKLSLELTQLYTDVTKGKDIRSVIVTHQPQTITQFIENQRRSNIHQDATITPFKIEGIPQTKKIEATATMSEVIELVGDYIPVLFTDNLNKLLSILDSKEAAEAAYEQVSLFLNTAASITDTYKNMSSDDIEKIQPVLTENLITFMRIIMTGPYTQQERYLLFSAIDTNIMAIFAHKNEAVDILSTRIRSLFPNIEYEYMNDQDRRPILRNNPIIQIDDFDLELLQQDIIKLHIASIKHEEIHAVEACQLLVEHNIDEIDVCTIIGSILSLLNEDTQVRQQVYSSLNTIINVLLQIPISNLIRYSIYFDIKDLINQEAIQDSTILLIMSKLKAVLPSNNLEDYSDDPVSYEISSTQTKEN